MISKDYPQDYNYDKYVEWHEKNIKNDVPLIENIDKFRNELKKDYRTYFNQIGQLLTQINSYCSKEIKIQYKDIVKGENQLPLQEISSDENSISYDNLFKPTKSIVDKLWRKNHDLNSDFINISNIKLYVKDLARTSVVCPSLLYAKFFAERLKQWKTVIEPDDITKHLPKIIDVVVDDEAKLASGYFAYHSTISFENDNFIEIQIYSQLSSIWRNLSHNIYANSRLGNIEQEGFGKTNTRLVSLGHMLHLAECEIERIQKEIISK
ncbi:MAG: hypothetical protein AB1521_11025 [Bacteroidota bacterium]